MKLLLVFLLVLGCGLSHKLPSYIERCRKNDPNLEDCILKSAQKAVPRLMQGDASINVFDINNTPTQNQILNVEGVTYSIENIKHRAGELVPIFVRINIEESYAIIGMSLPFLEWKGDFHATGEHNGKNIDAAGKFTIKYDELQINYTRHFTNKVVKDVTYLQIQVEKDETVGHINHISIAHDYNAKAHGKKEVESLFPKFKEALQQRLQELCSGLVSYIMNLVLITIPKSELFLE